MPESQRIAALVLAALAVGVLTKPRTPAPPPQPVAALSRSAPSRIEIQHAQISAPVVPVGSRPDGGVAVPPLSQAERTGWYEPGPAPGQPGPAVIVGHFDSVHGPAAFFRLSQVHRGDRITVHLQDGDTAVFQVDSVQRVAKTAFPASQVFAKGTAPELWLITCAGHFDPRLHSYDDNLMVHSHLVASARNGASFTSN